jgi:hypothetical protein
VADVAESMAARRCHGVDEKVVAQSTCKLIVDLFFLRGIFFIII